MNEAQELINRAQGLISKSHLVPVVLTRIAEFLKAKGNDLSEDDLKMFEVEFWPQCVVRVRAGDPETALMDVLLTEGWLGGSEHQVRGYCFRVWVREVAEEAEVSESGNNCHICGEPYGPRLRCSCEVAEV